MRVTSVMVGFCLMGIGLPLFAQDQARQVVRVTNTEQVDFAPDGVIRLNTSSGNLTIEAWDQPGVEITTIKSTRSTYGPGEKDQAARCLDSVRVVTERRSSTELAISTVLPARGFLKGLVRKCGVSVDHRIRAPKDARLVIQHDTGYVFVSQMTGDIEAKSRRGDIMLMLPDPGPYAIDAKSKIGSVYSDFTGATHRKKVVSEQFTNANAGPSHRIYLRMGVGGINIMELPATP